MQGGPGQAGMPGPPGPQGAAVSDHSTGVCVRVLSENCSTTPPKKKAHANKQSLSLRPRRSAICSSLEFNKARTQTRETSLKRCVKFRRVLFSGQSSRLTVTP